jgi:hypothetical protein
MSPTGKLTDVRQIPVGAWLESRIVSRSPDKTWRYRRGWGTSSLAVVPVERCLDLVVLIPLETKGASTMATQIVMDHTGDTRYNFDPADAKALSKAEQRFQELTGAGFTAAVRTATGDPAVTRRFDPAAKETLFFPRLVGG